jgi:hypothetical protein
MYYYLKTDTGPPDYCGLPFRKGHFHGICQANSPEEAEFKFRRHLARLLSTSDVTHNRSEAAKRMAKKDFEVAEYQTSQKDPHWFARVVIH